MTVDEILASGVYTDRRGRVWRLIGRRWTEYLIYSRSPITTGRFEYSGVMRLLIERDMHRDECHRRGASNCIDHPVPIVYWNDREDAWMARPAGGWPPYEDVPLYLDLIDAMDAARALAVGE